jgi:hypothetical protein
MTNDEFLPAGQRKKPAGVAQSNSCHMSASARIMFARWTDELKSVQHDNWLAA